MKINVQTNGVIITAKQKSLIEKKVSKMKKYLSDEEPVTIDVILSDETGPEKGGVDQTVRINTTFGKEKIIIEEVDDRLMRAFAYALNRFERQLSRQHHRKVAKVEHGGGGRLEKVWKIVRRK